MDSNSPSNSNSDNPNNVNIDKDSIQIIEYAPTNGTNDFSGSSFGNASTPIFSGKAQFTGKAGEFFGIWIVNILLSILTLGIYSAWAKVRTNRYFYSNTSLDGHRFDYLASPINILKGRILAFIALIIFSILTDIGIVPIYVVIVMALASIFIVPWVINMGLRFKMRMTRHRNVRFSFSGTYWPTFLHFILYPIMTFLTLGILFPWVAQQVDKYIKENSYFGDKPFSVDTRASKYYLAVLFSYISSTIGFMILFAITIVALIFYMILGSTGLTESDFIENISFAAAPFFFGFLIVALFLSYTAIIAISQAIYLTLVRNHLFESTKLSDIASFNSDLKIKDTCIVMITNQLAILFSLGFAYPWAKIRITKLMVESTCVDIYPEVLQLIDKKAEDPSSFGEEAVDMFDIEI